MTHNRESARRLEAVQASGISVEAMRNKKAKETAFVEARTWLAANAGENASRLWWLSERNELMDTMRSDCIMSGTSKPASY